MNHAERQRLSDILGELNRHCFQQEADDHTLDLIDQALTIVDAPMDSTNLYPQMIGRASRPVSFTELMTTTSRSSVDKRKAESTFLDTPSRGIDTQSIWDRTNLATRSRKKLVLIGLCIVLALSFLATALTSDSGPKSTPVVEDTVRAKLPTRTSGIGPRHAYGVVPYQPRHAYGTEGNGLGVLLP